VRDVALKAFTRPNDSTVSGANGKATLSWSSEFPTHMNKICSERQKIIDSEVLRLCSPYVPLQTGTLVRSGTLGTVIGSGEVKYIAPYARAQYYNTSTSRSYDARRGGLWFDRMKTANKDQILKLVGGK
jgi:hypothetical protein